MGGRILAVIAFLGCAGVVFWFALVHTVHRGTLAVPDVGEQTAEHARQQLHDVGLELEIEDPGVFSATIEPGAIAVQDPPPGFHVKSGATIRVRLSLGGERIAVPDLLGTSMQTAQRELEVVGLDPGVRAKIEGHGGSDRIIATDPPALTEVAPATAVDLLVNAAPNRTSWVMPSFLSRRIDWVRRFCRTNRLRLGQAHEVSYPGLPGGIVLRQYPPAGSPLAPSDIITVWVSK